MILKSCIEKLMQHENLNSTSCELVLQEMLQPTVNKHQLAAFLVLLRAKQETADELVALVRGLRHQMVSVTTKNTVLDIVGTGGDGHQTINISTGSAMLAAACGVKVVKHGNRAVSSLTGSADVLQALGIRIELTAEQVGKSVDEIGIGFCYAPNFHPATKALRECRIALNIPTSFNLLGPFLNPAQAKHLILGVFNQQLVTTLSDALIKLNCGRSVVVHGTGLDEISTVGPIQLVEINDQNKHEYIVDPIKFGLSRCKISDLRGGDATMNARILSDVFKGQPGPIADTLILNAAVALYIYGQFPSIAEGIAHARENLASGAVTTLLNHWIEFSHDQ